MKKLLVIVLSVMLFITAMFSGCTLVETNTAKYMDTVVATVKSDDYNIEVTKQELLRYYNNYYDTYVNSYGYTPQETVKLCLDMIINQKLLVSYLKKSGVQLTQNDKNSITLKVFDYVEESLSNYIAQIKNDWGIKDETTSTTDEDKTYPTKEEFTPEYEYVYNEDLQKWEIKYVLDKPSAVQDPELKNYFESYFWTEEERGTEGFTAVGAIKTKMTPYSDGINEEAMKRFVKDLKNNEAYRNYKNSTSYDIFMREYNRVYKIYEDNKYIEKLEDSFKNEFVLSSDDVIDYMSYKLNSQKELYDDENSIFKVYNEAMKSDATTVYYHPTTSWFNVMHVLIGYSDAQKELISTWKQELENGIITQIEYDANVNTLKNEIVGQARDSEGKLVGSEKSLSSIYNEIKNALAQLGNDAQGKLNKFDEFMYKYSTDEGSLNRDYDYAIPLDAAYDTMVSEFATASRELYNNGIVGAISEPIMSEYGAHIIIYSGISKNVVNNINSLTINDLINTKLKPTSEKSMFDIACGGVEAQSFDVYQNNIVSQLRAGVEIEIYSGRFSEIGNANNLK